MYLILICDDDLIFGQLLEKKVKAYMKERQIKCETELYTDGNELLEKLRKKTPEAIFLDIDMPAISGMEMAEQIFKNCINTNVIFVTNRDDLVFQAIHYQPFRFIRKEKLEEELEEALGKLMEKIDKDEKMLELQTKDGNVVVPLKDVIYLESCKHYLTVYHQDGCSEIRGKISNFEKWMTDYGFIRIHRSYLVNMHYIKTIRANGVELDNDELLPISREKVQEIKKQHMVYLRSFAYANH